MCLKRNYDTIAWFYDRLARLVYGKTLVQAQQFLIKAIPANTNVLIVGGGTGWVLEEILKIHTAGLNITYVDASAEMIARAQKRNAGKNTVGFIAAPIENAGIVGTYDVVLTPFLFDNFTDDSLRKIFSFIDAHVAADCMWLYCDFQNTEVLWQKTLLKVMYIFFRVSCGIEASCLPDAGAYFTRFGYQIKNQKGFMNGFILSAVYERRMR